MKRWKDSHGFALLLNLLLPGAGHFYWRDYVFGVFVFLILLMAAALFFVSFLVHIPTAGKAALFALPAIFYLFTFVDLARTVNKKKYQNRRTLTAAILFLIIAALFQVLAPITPLNFTLRNKPGVFRVGDNGLAPILRSGDFARSNPLAYRVNMFFLDQSIWIAVPDRGDIVRFLDRNQQERTGLVLGLSNEEVEIIDGQLRVRGFPQPFSAAGLSLRGDMPLTLVDSGSILVANFNLGAVDRAIQVPLDQLTGKVSKLF